MCRPCLYTAHVYRDDVTLDLGRYYIYGTNSQSQSILTYIIVSHISDHFPIIPIIVKLHNVQTASAPKFMEYRDFSHANSISFTTALCALDWNDVYYCF
jgi:hypothetical protein